ncbi:hypothetical protein EIM28_07700 [Campylobacter coli]|nr:hypothetical protein [Campylobacter coli]
MSQKYDILFFFCDILFFRRQNQCQNSSNKQSFACHKASALSKEILKIQLKKISEKLLFTILI